MSRHIALIVKYERKKNIIKIYSYKQKKIRRIVNENFERLLAKKLADYNVRVFYREINLSIRRAYVKKKKISNTKFTFTNDSIDKCCSNRSKDFPSLLVFRDYP